MKKITVGFLAVLLLNFVFVGCSANNTSENSDEIPEKVIIGTQTLANPESIVKAKGWLSEALGTEVDIVNFDSGRDVNTAMASGSIDFGVLGSVPASLAVANDVSCKVVYIQSILGEVESLIVRDSLGIKNTQELKGCKIATNFASTSHYSLLKYLEVNNVNPSDVDILDMRASEIVSAFVRGDIDGAFIWEPQVADLINNGGVTLTSAREIAELGYATMDVEIVRTDFAEKYPETVKAYIQCIQQAVELYNSDPESAGEAMSIDLGLPAEKCLAQVASSKWPTVKEQKSEKWFGSQALADTLYDTAMFLYEQGEITSEPSIDSFRSAVTGEYLD